VGGNKIEAHTIENEDSLSLDGVNGVVHKGLPPFKHLRLSEVHSNDALSRRGLCAAAENQDFVENSFPIDPGRFFILGEW